MKKNVQNFLNLLKDNKKNLIINFLYLIVLTVSYSLLFNIPLIKMNYPEKYFLLAFLASIFRDFIIWTIAYLNKYFFAFFSVITFAAGGGLKYVNEHLGMGLNIGVFELLFETNFEEAAGVLNKLLITNILIGVVVSIVFIVIRFKYIKVKPLGKELLIIAISLVFLFFGKLPEDFMKTIKFGYNENDVVKTGRGFDIMPEKIYENIYHYTKNKIRIKKMYNDRKNMPLPNVKYSSEGDKLIIFVLTDALRPDHMSLYGYERDTTPFMKKYNFIGFNDMYACETSTTRSVPCLTSRMNRGQNLFQYLEEPTLITMFKSAGFATAWISAQGSISTSDTGQAVIASDADYIYFNNPNVDRPVRYDMELLDLLDEFMTQYKDKKNKFVLLHLNGSHWSYNSRYSQDNATWKPDCNKWVFDCKNEEVVNAYDNSIVEYDKLLKHLVEKFKDKDTVIYTSSDHAEFLGEDGKYLHAHEMLNYKEVSVVPFALWISDKAKNSINMNIIEKNKNKYSLHDNIFHSITDCAGIESDLIDKTLSICSETMRDIPNQFKDYKSKAVK